MSERATELARHCLGLTNGRNVSYRNYYVCGAGCPDHSEWLRMVKIGDAVRFDGKALQFGGDDMFKLTLKGARAVLREGERLEAERCRNDQQAG